MIWLAPVLGDNALQETEDNVVTYTPKTKPFAHQDKEFREHRETPARAIFWEQGTGKTKATIDAVGYNYAAGNIDGLLVVAPNGVHRNWISDELPTHLPDDMMQAARCHVYQSKKAKTKWHQQAVKALMGHKGLAVMCISFDGFMTKEGKEAVRDFLHYRKTFYVVDESGRIKSPTAQRTKTILKSAPYAPFRRILNGTPIVQGPFDAFSQIAFLDQHFWHRHELGSYTIFKQHFGVWQRIDLNDGRKFDKLVTYRRLDELKGLLDTISTRVTKEDVLDLPPKLYSKRYLEMTPEQTRLYEQLKKEYMALITDEDACLGCGGTGAMRYEDVEAPCVLCEGAGFQATGMVAAELPIVRLLRLQQIASGYVPVEKFDGSEDPEMLQIPGGNPRLELLAEIVEDLAHPFIVFARFTTDIDLIMERLAALGISAVRYDGQVDDEGKAAAKDAFQKDRTAQAFVANTAAAAEGLTLTAAKTVIYYTNYFSLHYRLQSEDRAHRIGQEQPVQYIDLVAPGTVDEQIVKALRNKFDVAVQITGDRLKEWMNG